MKQKQISLRIWLYNGAITIVSLGVLLLPGWLLNVSAIHLWIGLIGGLGAAVTIAFLKWLVTDSYPPIGMTWTALKNYTILWSCILLAVEGIGSWIIGAFTVGWGTVLCYYLLILFVIGILHKIYYKRLSFTIHY